MEQEKVLIVSCYFPPAGGISVQRALSLAKYLPQNGFEVHVLTARNPAVAVYDPDLIHQVPDCVRVHRALTLEPPFQLRKKLWRGLKSGPPKAEPAASNGTASGGLKSKIAALLTRLICPDPQVLWRPFALRKASRIIERERIGVVIVTAPPFSAFLIGNALKARFPHIKLISDFRDEWLRYFLNEFEYKGNSFVRDRSIEIERATVEVSDLVVAVTPTGFDTIRSRYPDLPDEKFSLIPNGYDPEVFKSFRPRPHNSGKIVVTYAGTVYGPSSPVAYLDALDRLPDGIRSRFETRFVGRIAEEVGGGIFQDRKSAIKLLGFLPHRDALTQMEEADYLLLPWSDRLNVPGKLYEYLATKKPILGLVRPGSDADHILEESGSALLADGSSIDAIQQLLGCLGQSPNGRFHPNPAAIEKYERPRLATKYASLIRR